MYMITSFVHLYFITGDGRVGVIFVVENNIYHQPDIHNRNE